MRRVEQAIERFPGIVKQNCGIAKNRPLGLRRWMTPFRDTQNVDKLGTDPFSHML